MIAVTSAEFYDAIGPRDITVEVHPDHTAFSRRGVWPPIGRKTPGYKGPFWEPVRYFIDEDFLASTKGKKS